jgi:hypothetical protein
MICGIWNNGSHSFGFSGCYHLCERSPQSGCHPEISTHDLRTKIYFVKNGSMMAPHMMNREAGKLILTKGVCNSSRSLVDLALN